MIVAELRNLPLMDLLCVPFSNSMASLLIPKRAYWVAFIYAVLVSHASHGFYLPGSYMHTYSTGDEIFAKVNSLTSIETELPFSYYTLPYCKTTGGIKNSAKNLGELLMGDQIDNSPYRFRMNINESVFLCITSPLSEHGVKLLKQRTCDLYQVNMNSMDWFPVGCTPPDGNEDYVINHLKFRVLVHEYEGAGVQIIGTGEEGMGVISQADKEAASGYEIVGFEVVPCNVKHDPDVLSKPHMYDNISVNCPLELDKSQIIREQDRVSFTYEVEFVRSDIRWPSRWDAYLKMKGARVDWFLILNSLMAILFLAGIVFVIFLQTVRRDLARYEELDKEAQAQMNEELSGWKLVVGDVFREPNHSKLLCVMIGDGVQISGMAIVTIVFAAFGFISPASRGMLLTGMIILYLFLGTFAGYAGVRLWRTIKGTSDGWSIVPLTLLGGFLGTRAEPIQYPVRTNQIPREIPARKYPSWLLVLGAGTLQFGTLFIELLFILTSIWLGRFYYDWQWWWKAFYASGSVALYVFLYSINYLVFDLKSLSGPVS
ncbi:unnamed protein product [Camellia sinensis]